MEPANERFPQQEEPSKLHGTYDHNGEKEKYMRDGGKIEDLPESDGVAKMSSEIPDEPSDRFSSLTDRSGEEKKEDYINTDERKKDIDPKTKQ